MLQAYKLAQAIAVALNDKQEELAACKWADGESNTDTDFSNLAAKTALEVWDTIEDKGGLTLTTAQAPDINLVFKNAEGKTIKAKIELKSSKSATMPGSTIGKLDINQPLIFCLRTPTAYKLRAAQYHQAMGESDYDLFQDRTPRPQINFNKMPASAEYVEKEKSAWVEHYAACAVRRTTSAPTKSWQDDLTKAIIDQYLKSTSLADIEKRRNPLLEQ